MIKKVGRYGRFSGDNQREESIDAQLRAIEAYCKQKGYVIVETYIDRAKSATSDKRPEFQRMIADSGNNKFDFIIVHKLDRFSRNRYDSAFYKRKLNLNGVRLLSVTENLDDSPESGILESVIEGMAEYYSRNLAREVMKGMKETAYQCKHTGGLPPIGYSVDPVTKRYLINEEERGIVETTFSMFLAGYGYNQIVRELAEKGYRSRYGRPISKGSLPVILNNEKYTGVYIYNLTDSKDAAGKRNSNRKKEDEDVIRIEGGMPVIISKEDFWAAQEKIKNNQGRPGSYKAKEMYLLSGLCYCGECLKQLGTLYSMAGNVKYSGRNKLKYVTYRCGNRDRTKECKNPELRREYIENYVLAQLEEKIFNDQAIPILVKQLNEFQASKDQQHKGEQVRLSKSLDGITRQVENIVKAVADGFANSALLEKMNSLEEQREEIEQQLSKIKPPIKEKAAITEDTLRQLLSRFKDEIADRNIPEIKKFIGSYVKKVVIYKEHVDVIFKLNVVDLQDGAEGSRTPVRR
ncbi:recombinase [Paenibacillus sp. IHB B 3415]|uniref:recombinase family protein n=1 Tax=Paenibacillus sp. IHB B 3415 TaxID=867080 RepID=UPI000575551E|nr:recombinase family protein [Paenibacillus sp. IHB B 3415]KHL95865.1 recombinase [Paenibacillus sp. IHB B 3415]